MTAGTSFSKLKETLVGPARQTRRTFTAGAAAALMAFSAAVVPVVGVATPAQADQVSVLKGKIRALETHTKAMHKVAQDADARGATADKLAGCYDYLTKGIRDGKIDSAGVRSKVAGRPLRDVACKIAAQYGYNA